MSSIAAFSSRVGGRASRRIPVGNHGKGLVTTSGRCESAPWSENARLCARPPGATGPWSENARLWGRPPGETGPWSENAAQRGPDSSAQFDVRLDQLLVLPVLFGMGGDVGAQPQHQRLQGQQTVPERVVHGMRLGHRNAVEAALGEEFAAATAMRWRAAFCLRSTSGRAPSRSGGLPHGVQMGLGPLWTCIPPGTEHRCR